MGIAQRERERRFSVKRARLSLLHVIVVFFTALLALVVSALALDELREEHVDGALHADVLDGGARNGR